MPIKRPIIVEVVGCRNAWRAWISAIAGPNGDWVQTRARPRFLARTPWAAVKAAVKWKKPLVKRETFAEAIEKTACERCGHEWRPTKKCPRCRNGWRYSRTYANRLAKLEKTEQGEGASE
jgi:hypothetical protein